MYKQLKNDKGFTIIEIMIVLAIAALILIIVLLAVPALQRNSKNTTMKNDANAVTAAMTDFESNNNGTTPAAGSSGQASVGKPLYLCATGTVTACEAGTTSGYVKAVVSGGTTVNINSAVTTPANATPVAGTIDVLVGQDCTPSTNSTAVAIYYPTIQTSGSPTTTCIQG